jgi:asparagine synthase (glutamine-hydrolysing)
MCGIVGVFRTHENCDADRLIRMRDALTHRGPDDAGLMTDGTLGLAQRRLSIIDLSPLGHQPMVTEDGRYSIVYNGEIYNYPELRAGLEARGVKFVSQSDTEVILKLHVADGDGAVEKLNGIFAYAIWDKLERRLLLARDRAGIKPLYLAQTSQGIAFASEIKALFHSGLVTPAINEKRLAEFLVFRQVAGNENLFAGIEVLPPGHTMVVRDGRAEPAHRYWTVRSQPPKFAGTFADATDALDALLNRAVQRQLMSDVPLGTFCSGGIDSSLTTVIAARHMSRAINTFSVGFHEADFDESVYARMASKAAGSTHHELKIDEAEFTALLPKLIEHHDLPLNFANSVHIYAISKLARQHVTVVLTGEGADELFGGYPRYYIPRLLEPFQKLPGALRGTLLSLLKAAPDHRMRKLAAFAGRDRDDVLLYNCTGVDPALARRLLGRRGEMPLEFRLDCIRDARARGLDEVSALAELDFQTYLVSILNRQDKMSMATSIESRVPFLDNEIIDFARGLPREYRQTLRHRKRVLKAVALRYLPAEIVHRRKSGFGVPLKNWFAGSGPMGKLLDEAANSTAIGELMDASHLRTVIADHRAGRADYSEMLWSVVNLRLWRQAFGA